MHTYHGTGRNLHNLIPNISRHPMIGARTEYVTQCILSWRANATNFHTKENSDVKCIFSGNTNENSGNKILFAIAPGVGIF